MGAIEVWVFLLFLLFFVVPNFFFFFFEKHLLKSVSEINFNLKVPQNCQFLCNFDASTTKISELCWTFQFFLKHFSHFVCFSSKPYNVSFGSKIHRFFSKNVFWGFNHQKIKNFTFFFQIQKKWAKCFQMSFWSKIWFF